MNARPLQAETYEIVLGVGNGKEIKEVFSACLQ